MQSGIFFGFVKRNFGLKCVLFIFSVFLLTACDSDSTSSTTAHPVNNKSNFAVRFCNQPGSERSLQGIDTSAFVCRRNIKLSFDIHGNGIAVWEDEKESRVNLVYSLFNSSNKTWSKKSELAGVDKVTGLITFNHIEVRNGPGYSVTWEQPGKKNKKEFFVANFNRTSLLSIKRIEPVDGYSVDLYRLVAQLKHEKQLKK